MQNNLQNKSLIRTLALSSILLPIITFSSNTAFAAEAPTKKLLENTVSVTPTNNAKKHLMDKLAKLSFFSANFNQKILDGQGALLQQGTGTLAISKPNLVHWKAITPDETLIISDGDTLWFYDPFIEQASAFSLAESINNTPILLLTSDEPQFWQQYNVIENTAVIDNVLQFIVTPKTTNSQIKKLSISFTKKNENEEQLSEFSFEDSTGQVSQISLSQFNNTLKPAASLFTFSLPEGSRLEDKR